MVPDLEPEQIVSDFVCDHRPGDAPKMLATISGFVPNEAIRYEVDPPPTDSLKRTPADASGTKTLTWYCEERHAPREITYTVHALDTNRSITFSFSYVLAEDEG